MNLPYIISESSVTVFLDGKTVPVGHAHGAYNEVLTALRSQDEATLRKLLLPKQEVVKLSAGRVQMVNGELTYEGATIHSSLTSRILSMFKDGFDVTPMLMFLDNLYENPSKRAVEELYGFLDACHLPITADGFFLAYKMIRDDYTDIYTGTMDNSVGSIVKMPRRAVDEDKERTCSDGLHFCSLEYVTKGNYGSSSRGQRVVVVKINPANVVAIPVDYNNAKGRACEYLILEEIDWTTRIEYGSHFSQETEEEEWDDNCPDCGEQSDDCNCGSDWANEDEEARRESERRDTQRAAQAKADTSRKLDKAGVQRFLKLLNKDKLTLTAACAIVGISRRQGGRIRDGENWAGV